jgi:uncharacterized protein YndB with AHSA1/START domain
MTTADRAPARSFSLGWTLDASPERVFRAWTDPTRLDWFYNPEQPIPTEPIELDLRVGGAWRQRMVIDPQTNYMTGGVYREIVPNERLVFAWGAEGGWPKLDPADLDAGPQVTLTFEPKDGRTELTLAVEIPASMPDDGVPEWWQYAEQGWRQTVDRLVASAATSQT